MRIKRSIVNFVKYNKVIYFIYYHLAGVAINILKLFVKTDDKLIMFNSFAGRNYDDSPRAIYEKMCKDNRFNDCRMVWAFHNPGKHRLRRADVIKTDGIKYFITALSARVWITNSSVERGLRFKGKNTVYINTWHGTPIKRMGRDIDARNMSFKSKSEGAIDYMMSQGKYETRIFSRAFRIPKERFIESGLPRNDVLCQDVHRRREIIRKRLKIDDDKTVILYCPTFREYNSGKDHGIVMDTPICKKKWKNVLGDRFVIWVRAHYEVSQIIDRDADPFFVDMTDYPRLNDLIIASDVLISDYSSLFFDYSITGKPMLYYTYDYDKYSSERGMYFDIRDYLSGGESEDEILDILKNMDANYEREKTISFRDRFVNYYGKATDSVIDTIARLLDDGK